MSETATDLERLFALHQEAGFSFEGSLCTCGRFADWKEHLAEVALFALDDHFLTRCTNEGCSRLRSTLKGLCLNCYQSARDMKAREERRELSRWVDRQEREHNLLQWRRVLAA